jgi:hypothetical protein
MRPLTAVRCCETGVRSGWGCPGQSAASQPGARRDRARLESRVSDLFHAFDGHVCIVDGCCRLAWRSCWYRFTTEPKGSATLWQDSTSGRAPTGKRNSGLFRARVSHMENGVACDLAKSSFAFSVDSPQECEMDSISHRQRGSAGLGDRARVWTQHSSPRWEPAGTVRRRLPAPAATHYPRPERSQRPRASEGEPKDWPRKASPFEERRCFAKVVSIVVEAGLVPAGQPSFID